MKEDGEVGLSRDGLRWGSTCSLVCTLVLLIAARIQWDAHDWSVGMPCVLVALTAGVIALVLFVWAELLLPGNGKPALSASVLEAAQNRFDATARPSGIETVKRVGDGFAPELGQGRAATATECASRPRTTLDGSSSRGKVWSGVWVLLLIFLWCGGLFGYELTHGWTPEKVKRLVSTSCPPGTSRAEVKAWLAANPFSDTECESYGADSPKGCYVREVKLDPRNLSDCLWICVPNPNVDLIGTGELEVYFFFDKQDRLLLAYVRPWVRGL